MSMTPLAERAVSKLDAWLRNYDAEQFSTALDELREAVEHFAQCDGTDRTCADITDECEGGDNCPHCATDCQDCQTYRHGGPGTWTATRPVLQLLEEVEAREADLFDVA